MKYFFIPAFFIILLFSCNSSPKNSTTPASNEDDVPIAPEEPKQAKTHIVEIKQMRFEPQDVKVQKGDRVVWVNKDITSHDVTEESKKVWTSSPLATGQSWSLVVTQAADYYCSLHQVMKGKITVIE